MIFNIQYKCIALVFCILFFIPLHGQTILSPNGEKVMTDNAKATVQNYYAMIANIGSTNNSFDERRLFIEDVISSYFLNESIRVCNDLYTGGVPDYAIRDYLGTIMSTYPRSEGVKFKHTIKEIKGPYIGQGDFAFYLLRVERHLLGLNTSGIMQDATMTLDFYLRFDHSGGKWNYTPKIYDIRKAELGIEGRFTKWKEKDMPTVSAKSATETPKEKDTLSGVNKKIESKPIVINSSGLPAPVKKLIDDMVYVKGGTFTMGCKGEQGSDCNDNEKPTHAVTLSNFYIGKFEVTQVQWRAVMGSDPTELFNKGCDKCPVERVSWNEVQDFITKLNQQTGKHFRLPTEAEWEYAARGGNKSKGYKYSGSDNIGTVAWYGDNSGNNAQLVGQKQANELGLYDMSGNVWEWCSDWFGAYSSSSQTNPTGSYRVIRGGSWLNYKQSCRVLFRNSYTPTNRNAYLGFRLALTS